MLIITQKILRTEEATFDLNQQDKHKVKMRKVIRSGEKILFLEEEKKLPHTVLTYSLLVHL